MDKQLIDLTKVYLAKVYLEKITAAIEDSAFKGYVKAEISKAGFVVLVSTVSGLRWINRERAYPDAFDRLEDLSFESWLAWKELKKQLKERQTCSTLE